MLNHWQKQQINKAGFVQNIESDKKKQKTQKNSEVFIENRHI